MDTEPEPMPATEPEPVASSVPEEKPDIPSDQVCEPALTSVSGDIS